MAKTTFTVQELQEYFLDRKKNPIINEARLMETQIRVHAEGIFPEDLINKARPNESPEVLEYRKKIYKSKTKPTFNKIYNSLSKIRRSSDWAITFENEDEFSKIPEEESLKEYTTEYFPYFTNVTNWAFQSLLREYLIDPNALVSVYPEELPVDESAFVQPYPHIINSSKVVDFKEGDYAVYENELGAWFVENGVRVKGKSFFVITTVQVLRYDQVNLRLDYALGYSFNHNIGELPVYKIGATLIKSTGTEFLYESRIAGCLTSFDEAVREYSDLQAAVVMHIYPERWEYATIACHECNGIGKKNVNSEFITCPHCKGLGNEPNSPFSKLLIKPTELGQQPTAVPPAGFIEKDTEIVKLQDERVKRHIYDALAAINMEFLAEPPLTQSGIAKEVDRDETNNFVHSVAEDIVRCLDWLMYIIAKYRYSVQYPSEEDINNMLPTINVPEHFDIFSTKFIEEELKASKDNKINPILINAMEIEYAIKKFSSDPDIQKRLLLILELDPLANISEDDKQARLTNKGITLQDYVLSSNIVQFVGKAIEENSDFVKLDKAKQLEVLMKYVEETIGVNDEKASAAIDSFMNNGGNGLNSINQPANNKPPVKSVPANA